MQFDRPDPGYNSVATLDIETTHYDSAEGEVVSIGLGLHTSGDPAREASYHVFNRTGDGEAAVIDEAMDWLQETDPDGLVTFNGEDFDLDFLGERIARLGADDVTGFPRSVYRNHVDLFLDRKERAERLDQKWPGLEECLESCGYPVPKTVWRGQELTNTTFGEEFAPEFLDAVSAGRSVDDLAAVLEHYLKTDLEANFAIYYADIGQSFEPRHLSNSAEFQ